MKKYLLFLSFSILLSSCIPTDIIFREKKYRETKELQVKVSDEDIQRQMAMELYQFYINSDKSFEFYEIKWSSRYLINYNPKKQKLYLATDICSGWTLPYYTNVTAAKFKELGESNLLFEQYGSVLDTDTSDTKLDTVKTNSCIGYQGKK